MSYQVAVAEEVSPDIMAAAQTSASSSRTKDSYQSLILEHRENGRKLARSMLRRWRARMNPDEVDSIVDLTLCEAAKRYSTEHGASFMTFFFYHLRGCLVRAVANAVNSSQVVLAFEHDAADDAYGLSGLAEQTPFGMHEAEGPEHAFLRKEKIQVCRTACNQLDELEQEVILRSFQKEESLVSIASSLGYSRCHISRVKKRALERLEAILSVEGATKTSSIPVALERMPNRQVTPDRRTRRRNRRRQITRTTALAA